MNNSKFYSEMWRVEQQVVNYLREAQNQDRYFIKLLFQQQIPSVFDPLISDFG